MNHPDSPTVSICVPSLNTFPYLADRFSTIFGQSFDDWELLVYDSYSDDGSWEYIQKLASTDGRMRIWQGPREGVYAAWNTCIHQARGKYIYIATSDDTMAADCLQKLVAALELHSDCDLSHCPLVIIDENSHTKTDRPAWPHGTAYDCANTEWMKRPNVQRAPYVGLLHLAQAHVYLSITQVLIRRSLFTRTGYFQTTWGTVSDFNWEMRAGLVASLVHVPDTWASWRVHSRQSSASINVLNPAHDVNFEAMIRDAIQSCERYLHPKIAEGLKSHWIERTARLRPYYAGLRYRKSWIRRRYFQIRQLVHGSSAVRTEILNRIRGRPKGGWDPNSIREWLESLSVGTFILSDSPVAGKCGTIKCPHEGRTDGR